MYNKQHIFYLVRDKMKKLILIVLSLYAAAQAKSFEELFNETEPMSAEIKENAQRLEDPTLTLEEKVALCARNHVLYQKLADFFRAAREAAANEIKQDSSNSANSSLTSQEQAAMTQRLNQLESRLQKLESDQAELKAKLR